MKEKCDGCGDSVDFRELQKVYLCPSCEGARESEPSRILALRSENEKLKQALELEHNSLCAFLDYAPQEIMRKCYDPKGAYLAGRAALEEAK